MMKVFFVFDSLQQATFDCSWQTVSQGRGSWDREVVSTGWRCRWICTSVQPESLCFCWKWTLFSCDEVIQSLRSLPLLCDVACRLPRLGSCALWKVGYGRVVISCFLMCCFSCHLGRIRWYLFDWEILHGFSVISAKVCVLSMALLLCASIFWSSGFIQETTRWFCPISIASSSCSPGNSSTIQALEALRPWTSTAFFITSLHRCTVHRRATFCTPVEALRFDCGVELAHWQTFWTDEKKAVRVERLKWYRHTLLVFVTFRRL